MAIKKFEQKKGGMDPLTVIGGFLSGGLGGAVKTAALNSDSPMGRLAQTAKQFIPMGGAPTQAPKQGADLGANMARGVDFGMDAALNSPMGRRLGALQADPLQTVNKGLEGLQYLSPETQEKYAPLLIRTQMDLQRGRR